MRVATTLFDVPVHVGSSVSGNHGTRPSDEVDDTQLDHPGLYHYGQPRRPERGTYDLSIRVEPPSFERHDRYDEPVEATFEDVDVETGRG